MQENGLKSGMVNAVESAGRVSVLWFAAFNFLVTIFMGLGFFRNLDVPLSDWPMLKVALISHYGGFWLVYGLLLALAVRRMERPLRRAVVLGVLALLPQVLLFLDLGIYRLFRYHINGIVLDVIFGGGLEDSVTIGKATTISFLIAVASLAAAEAAWLAFGGRLLGRFPALAGRRARKIVLGVVLACVAFDKAFYAWADLYNYTGFTKYEKAFPFYVRVTIKAFAMKRLGFNLEKEEGISLIPGHSTLNYPVTPDFPCPPPAKRLNFLVIILDSWRGDMVNPEVTPNAAKFRARCTDFRDNLATGNATWAGMFGLVYGLHATYWEAFHAERRGPVMIGALKAAGYRFRIISSTQLIYPQMRRTSFVAIPDAVQDKLPGTRKSERDAEQPGELFRFLDSDKGKKQPFFALMFFDCPHLMYDFPESFTKFKPVSAEVNYLKEGDINTVVTRNRYKNALYYDDYLVGKVIRGLEERGLLDSTVVILTGDHGEAHGEAGFVGHTSGYTLAHTHVPLLMHVPGRRASVVRQPTSNLDIAPTVLELAGCPVLGEKYTLGTSLLRPGPREYRFAAGWRGCGVYIGDRIVTYSMDFNTAQRIQILDKQYRPLPPDQQKSEMKGVRSTLLKVLADQRKFLK